MFAVMAKHAASLWLHASESTESKKKNAIQQQQNMAGNHWMLLIQGHNVIKENLTAHKAAVHLQCHRNMLEKNMADDKM